jgi:hypothetical protein
LVLEIFIEFWSLVCSKTRCRSMCVLHLTRTKTLV